MSNELIRMVRIWRVLVFNIAILVSVLPCVGATEVVPALQDDWQLLSQITAFHRIAETDTSFDVRLLESNGQTTVAINPITLYFVVTNNSSAGDLQEHVWRLPVRVAKVKAITPLELGIRIAATLDAMPDANVKQRDINIIIRYSVVNGALADKLAVERQ